MRNVFEIYLVVFLIIYSFGMTFFAVVVNFGDDNIFCLTNLIVSGLSFYALKAFFVDSSFTIPIILLFIAAVISFLGFIFWEQSLIFYILAITAGFAGFFSLKICLFDVIREESGWIMETAVSLIIVVASFCYLFYRIFIAEYFAKIFCFLVAFLFFVFSMIVTTNKFVLGFIFALFAVVIGLIGFPD